MIAGSVATIVLLIATAADVNCAGERGPRVL
jgi:hypothetical protein